MGYTSRDMMSDSGNEKWYDVVIAVDDDLKGKIVKVKRKNDTVMMVKMVL